MDIMICCICHHAVEDNQGSKLTVKGCSGINDASLKRQDNVQAVPGNFVHIACRKTYTNANVIVRDTKENLSPNT
ncbi:hypothetical protein DPMN_169273 [Dreissena polymorpha]|uniref:Uncharacterized protein n=2 Tax=Dreissena polymorpha TaxID=45954 RepID=A0A9D4EUM1_DREPO|nr:hypothetical protein DPMN_164659 [Dreissena polymorpha]KAH3791062.1 hypothetical protein DPMN_169273 [Dreissena polymorpha]